MYRLAIVSAFLTSVFLLAASSSCCYAADRPAPKCVGYSLDHAKQLVRLAEAELLVGIYFIADRDWRDDLRPETVYLQTPQPGASIDHSRVAVWLFRQAKPNHPTQVMPDVIGKTVADAKRELALARLLVMEIEEKSDEAIVRDQYPKAGRTVFQGTSVLLGIEP